MAEQIADPVEVGSGRWWELPEYKTGELILAGQSRLDEEHRELLQDIARRAEKGILDLPTMPHSAVEAMKLMRSDDAGLPEIAECLERDEVLVAHVLRRANSALYGSNSVIDTITHALSFLGLRRVKALVFEASMRQATNGIGCRTHALAEWKHSLFCAMLSRELAKVCGMDQDLCYTAGLLHDIGRLPVLQLLDQRGCLPSEPQADGPAEIIMETLHRGVGGQIAKAWDLPPAVGDAINHHLNGRMADEEHNCQFPSTYIIEAIGDLCYALGLGRVRRPFAILEAPSFQQLDVESSKLVAFFEDRLPEIVQEVEELV